MTGEWGVWSEKARKRKEMDGAGACGGWPEEENKKKGLERKGLCVRASPEKRVEGEKKGNETKRGEGAAAAKMGLAAEAPKKFERKV